MRWQRRLTGGFYLYRRIFYDVVIPSAILAFLIVMSLRLVPAPFDLVSQTWLGILGILLALLAAIGGLLWWFLARQVKESVEHDIKDRFSEIRGKLAIEEGFTLYNIGKYDDAIQRTKAALVERLDEFDIMIAKNNLAYYYAKRHEQQPLSKVERQQACRWAEDVYKKYDRWRERFNWPGLVETYVFVKARLTVDKEKRQELKKEIEDMLKRSDLAPIRQELQQSLEYLDFEDELRQ